MKIEFDEGEINTLLYAIHIAEQESQIDALEEAQLRIKLNDALKCEVDSYSHRSSTEGDE